MQSVNARHGLVKPKNAILDSDASIHKDMEAQAIFWQHCLLRLRRPIN